MNKSIVPMRDFIPMLLQDAENIFIMHKLACEKEINGNYYRTSCYKCIYWQKEVNRLIKLKNISDGWKADVIPA